MSDRLTSGLEALELIPVPVTWDMVEARASASGARADRDASDDQAGPPSRRGLILATVAVAVVAVALVAVLLARPDHGSSPLDTGPGTSTSSTSSTSTPGGAGPATTQPAVGTSWTSAVTAWTGTDYLVWSGQVGDDSRQRADGWRYDPATGVTADLPVAPIAPRDSAAGVWTGTELLVCCGRPANGVGPQYGTASAAAFDPVANEWRVLASPPAAAAGYTIGAAWTGREMLVLAQTGDAQLEMLGRGRPALYAYDPTADRWEQRASPDRGDRFSSVTWTGDKLAVWTTDGFGATFDPTTNTWRDLPGITGDAIDNGSIAWVDDQLVVWGLDRADSTRTVGYRLYLPVGCSSACRAGVDEWQPMAAAPIPPIAAYDGTPGSQTVLVDPDRSRLVIVPVTGYESGSGGVSTPPPSLLSYDPATDRWRDLHTTPIGGYAPELTVAGSAVLGVDRARPLVTQLPG